VPVGYLALATQPPLPVALGALAVAGFAAGPINPLLFTVQTEIVPSHLRGRVFGAVRAGAWAAIPLGILLGSAAVAIAGVAVTFLAMGVLLAAVVGYGYFNPAFREMDR
jgi:MFS family permease